jgi:hypothetical protein
VDILTNEGHCTDRFWKHVVGKGALDTFKKLNRSKEILMGNGNKQMGLILEVDGDYVDAYIPYVM